MTRKSSQSSPLFCSIDSSGFGMAMLLVVVFVLFCEMVYAPLTDCGPRPDLPQAIHTTKMPRAIREDAMVVTVFCNGWVLFGSNRVPPEELPQLIREQLKIGSEPKVYLKVDRNARHGVVERVVAEIYAANIPRVAFLVEPRQPPVPPPQ
jgi:biopolymer transport protein ExbD